MEKNSDPNKEAKTYCHSCGRYILTSNFLLHQGRCQRLSELKSSRVSQNNNQTKQPQSYSQKKQISKQEKYPDSKYSYSHPISREVIGTGMKKKNNSQINQNQNQQKIPCHFCGYMQTLEQLDSHPNVCQHWEVECEFCKLKYPKSLMNDHKQICQKNPRNIERNQRSRHNQMHRNDFRQNAYHQEEDHQGYSPMFYQQRNRNLYQPSPLMNFFNDPFFSPFMRGNNDGHRQPQMGPGLNFVQFTSNNNGQPRIIIRSNSSNPATFIQLIQMLARRANPNQNPGLNQQQLSRLTKTQYHKKNPQPDLCTICYCEFEQKQQIIQLKCKHMFHQQCIFQWLKRVSTCPICKQKLKNQGDHEEQEQFEQFEQQINEQHQHHQDNDRNGGRGTGGNNRGNNNRGNGGGSIFDFFRF